MIFMVSSFSPLPRGEGIISFLRFSVPGLRKSPCPPEASSRLLQSRSHNRASCPSTTHRGHPRTRPVGESRRAFHAAAGRMVALFPLRRRMAAESSSRSETDVLTLLLLRLFEADPFPRHLS